MVFRVFIKSTNRHKLKQKRGLKLSLHNLQIFIKSLHGLRERQCSFTFFPSFDKYELYKNTFFSSQLKEIVSYREGIIFTISPRTEKIYIGCFKFPTKRAVSGLRASAKFRKLSYNILFQAGDIQSEVLEKFQDITFLANVSKKSKTCDYFE